MYVENIYNYVHNFRRLVKYAPLKIEIVIENGWSLKLHQTHQVNTSPSIHCKHKTNQVGTGMGDPYPYPGENHRYFQTLPTTVWDLWFVSSLTVHPYIYSKYILKVTHWRALQAYKTATPF